MQLQVAPQALSKSGTGLQATADAARQHVHALLDGQRADDAATPGNHGLATATANTDCVTAWADALVPLVERLAVAGDRLTGNAAGYQAAEQANHARFTAITAAITD